MKPTVASTLHNVFSSCSGQIVNARKPATAVVPVTAPVGTGLELLDAGETGTKAKDLERKLHRLVIGQEEAIHEIVRTYQTYLAGLSPEGRPIGNFLFLGPTGTGKTRAVEATAEALLGNPNAMRVSVGTDEEMDAADAEALYATLENEVIPLFYSQDESGLPIEWIERMKNSIATLTPEFSSDRMVAEYLSNIYDNA